MWAMGCIPHGLRCAPPPALLPSYTAPVPHCRHPLPERPPEAPRSRGRLTGTAVAKAALMLRITDILCTSPDGHVTWSLRLEGALKGEWVQELRRVWRRTRARAAGTPIVLVLADVTYVDASGKVLLTEMHRDGVEIVAEDCLAGAIRDEVVAGPWIGQPGEAGAARPAGRRPRSSTKSEPA